MVSSLCDGTDGPLTLGPSAQNPTHRRIVSGGIASRLSVEWFYAKIGTLTALLFGLAPALYMPSGRSRSKQNISRHRKTCQSRPVNN
jgi:hypothetical protein